MNPDDLQHLIDRELKRLPTPHAPATLLPRVLAATVAGRPAPWYARAWVTWPLAWQVASLAILVAAGVGFSMFGPEAWQAAADLARSAAGSAPGRLAALAGALEGAVTLTRVCWQVLLEPVAVYLLVLAVSLSLACAAVWTVLERAALGGASQP
jgi:uncharacterized membrane protein YidH (DUF202 family)